VILILVSVGHRLVDLFSDSRITVPQDYDDLLSYYTKRGYRVIAVAGKSIESLSWLKAQRMKRFAASPLCSHSAESFAFREQAESGLRFLGLVIFENRLKPGTTPAIQSLRSANLACRMITGDNPLTAVSVARECSLISQSAHVFYPSFVHGQLFALLTLYLADLCRR
jgi:cation-transporting P-type ATPase 13A2